MLRRTHRLSGGRVVQMTIRDAGSDAVAVEVQGELTSSEAEELASAVRRIFQLDLDLSEFYEALEGRERYQWVEQHGAGRLLRAPTVWEDLAKTLLTTNTTWAMTRAMVKRLTSLGDAGDENRHAFPVPEQVAALSPDELDARVRAGYRSGYLHELAKRIAAGDVDVEAWATNELTADELYAQITALKGFGPYAAGAVLKLLGKFDRLALDSAARSMFAREFAQGERPLDAAITAHYEPYGKWRGLVMWMDLMGSYLREHI